MKIVKKLAPLYIAVLILFLIITLVSNHAVTVMAERTPIKRSRIFVIDAGHGGEDGGAISVTGKHESEINLEIALRLNDLLHLLGHETSMIRTSDRSVYTQGDTLAQKKISDLKQRVKFVNETPNGILVSIHQNTFSDKIYHGAQVFYTGRDESKSLADEVQHFLGKYLNPGNHRKPKKANGIYLMERINCPGILIECGFLSNYEEEAALQNSNYQKKLCCTIAAALSSHFNNLDRLSIH